MAHDLSAESNECADRLRSQPQAAGPGGEVKAHGRRAAAKMDVRVRLSAELVSLPLAGAVETSSKMTRGGEDGGGNEALWRRHRPGAPLPARRLP
jgi:hypothetical protein